MGQALFAALVGVGVVLLAGGAPRNPSQLLAWVLVALALAQLPVMVLIVTRLGAVTRGAGARRAALSTALLTGVLLASTAWFLALALATNQVGAPLFLLLAVTMLAYTVGFLTVGRLARVATSEVFEERAPAEQPDERDLDEPDPGERASGA